MKTQSTNNTAKEYNFWGLVGEYHLVFPRIQRDYAQGRKTFKATQVRESFLQNLHSALKDDTPTINLDFIYGVQKKGIKEHDTVFSPLDGQQRLTTLFLLHWYLAHKSGKYHQFKNLLTEGDEVKFLYETRDSAKEFCKNLIIYELNDIIGDNDISWNIKNQSWFLSMWIEDPTVEGMLTMLDAIDEEFKGADVNTYFDRLSGEDGYLRFYLLVFDENFMLGDDLYIKMNARGLPLTIFENFKASFEEELLDDKNPKKLVFKNNIDTIWTNMFWFPLIDIDIKKSPPATVDKEMMRFVRMVLSFIYATYPDTDKTDQEEIDAEEIDADKGKSSLFDEKIFGGLLINAKGKYFIPDEEQNFAYLTKKQVLDENAAERIIEAFQRIGDLWDEEKKGWMEDEVKPIGLSDVWKKFCESDKPGYETQLLLLSIIIAPDNNPQWFRLCRNLICNSIINDLYEMRWFINKLQDIREQNNFGLQ